MALSATTTSASRRLPDGRAVVEVTVTNDANGNVVGKEDVVYQPGATQAESKANLSAVVRAMIDRVQALNAAKVAPMVPNATVLDVAAAVASAPTQAELDYAQFIADFNAERTAQVLATLSAELRARYKPAYGALR